MSVKYIPGARGLLGLDHLIHSTSEKIEELMKCSLFKKEGAMGLEHLRAASNSFYPERTRKEIADARFGKKVFGNLYFHVSVQDHQSWYLREMVREALRILKSKFEMFTANVFKISPKGKVSFLFYPTFETEAHPVLNQYWTVDVNTYKVSHAHYDDPQKSMVLHRKETMVMPSHSCWEDASLLTMEEEDEGLLDNPPGKKESWDAFLKERGFSIVGHLLVKETGNV